MVFADLLLCEVQAQSLLQPCHVRLVLDAKEFKLGMPLPIDALDARNVVDDHPISDVACFPDLDLNGKVIQV
jgi:hypothetical protein